MSETRDDGSGGGETVPRDETDGSDFAPRANRRVVVVRAVRDFAAGHPVRVAYGARGNGHLALRYGFTIPANIEPDGSHNDVVPVRVRASASTRDVDDDASEREVTLRMAPSPAYTAGDFADALDAVAGRPRGVVERGARDEAPEGEDFLGAGFADLAGGEDEEDEEDEEDDDAWEAMYGGGDLGRDEDGLVEDGPRVRDVDDVESLAREVAAAEALRERLRELGRLALGSEPPASAEDANDEAEARRRRIATGPRVRSAHARVFRDGGGTRSRVGRPGEGDAEKSSTRNRARRRRGVRRVAPDRAEVRGCRVGCRPGRHR